MQLCHSPTSPFVRKVMICAHLKGVIDKIELIPTDATVPNDPLNNVNPLGKIPALDLDDGRTLFDSFVICDYLDSLSPEPRLFPQGNCRHDTLMLGALADGIMDAMILRVYEKRLRPEDKQFQTWVDRQTDKVDHAIAFAATHAPKISGSVNYGQVALACALGYLDLRANGSWRQSNPALVSWLDSFAAAVPSFESTKPPAA